MCLDDSGVVLSMRLRILLSGPLICGLIRWAITPSITSILLVLLDHLVIYSIVITARPLTNPV